MEEMKQILILILIKLLINHSLIVSTVDTTLIDDNMLTASKSLEKRRISIEWGRLERRVNLRDQLKNLQKVKDQVEEEKRNELYRTYLASRTRSSLFRDFFAFRYK